MIKSVREFLKSCPLLKGSKINVNYLGETPVEYSIDEIPVNPVVKRYVDGGTLRQYLFAVSSREAYDENALANMEISKFFEEFGKWIEEMDSKKQLPRLSEPKCQATKLEVISSGGLLYTDNKTARFQTTLKLTYRKEL